MKKLLAAFAILILAVSVSAPVVAHAADASAITATEQKILDELNKGATIGGKTVYFNAKHTTSASNYLKRVDLTEAQVTEAVTNIQSARSLFESQNITLTGNESVAQIVKLLPSDIASQLQSFVTKAGNAIGLTVTFTADGATLTDKEGKPVAQSGSVVKTTGVDVSTSIAVITVLFGVSAAAFGLNKKYGSEASLIAE